MPRNQCQLTEKGWEALQRLFQVLGYEKTPPHLELAKITGLDRATIAKIIGRKQAVQEKTLEQLFEKLSNHPRFADYPDFRDELQEHYVYYEEPSTTESKTRSKPEASQQVDAPVPLSPPEKAQVTQSSNSNQNPMIGFAASGSTINITYGQPALDTVVSKYFGVPYQRNPFFSGRQEILERLHQQLSEKNTTVITQVQAIRGLGGIGKTQTAVEYAYRYHFDQSIYRYVFWVKADTEINLATDFANLASQLALPVAKSTQGEKISAVHQWLATHNNWLLIFDNAVPDDWLTSFFPNHSEGTIVITSRASIFDQIGIKSPLFLDVLSQKEAIEFLFRRTGYERTEDNISTITEINQELDGLPLALEQASAFMVCRKIGFQTYLKTYRKRGLSQLESAKAQTGKYASSVLRTWKINFEALAEEQPISTELLELSAFLSPDDIPYCILTSGATYFGEVLGSFLQVEDMDEALLAIGTLLEPLSQYSLVKWQADKACYSMHRLVQAVVRDSMTDLEQKEWVERSVNAMSHLMPKAYVQNQNLIDKLLPHAETSIQLISKFQLNSEDALLLYKRTALHLFQLAKYRKSKEYYQQLLESSFLLKKLTISDYIELWGGLANVLYKQGLYQESEYFFCKSLEEIEKDLENKNQNIIPILKGITQLYRILGRYEEAQRMGFRLLEIVKDTFESGHPETAVAYNDLAESYRLLGDYEKSESLYKRALALRRSALHKNHPDVATTAKNLAVLYCTQKRYADAEPLLEEAIEIREQAFNPYHPEVAQPLNHLAEMYHDQGRYREAEPLYRRALEIRSQALDSEHPFLKESILNYKKFLNTVSRSVDKS